MIRLGFFYQTRAGEPVFISQIYPKGWKNGTIYRVAGYVGESETRKFWTIKGKYFSVHVQSDMDLVPRDPNREVLKPGPIKKKLTRQQIDSFNRLAFKMRNE